MVRYVDMRVPGGTPISDGEKICNDFRHETIDSLLKDAKKNGVVTSDGGTLALRSGIFGTSAGKRQYSTIMAFTTGYLMGKGYQINSIDAMPWEYTSMSGRKVKLQIPILGLTKR